MVAVCFVLFLHRPIKLLLLLYSTFVTQWEEGVLCISAAQEAGQCSSSTSQQYENLKWEEAVRRNNLGGREDQTCFGNGTGGGLHCRILCPASGSAPWHGAAPVCAGQIASRDSNSPIAGLYLGKGMKALINAPLKHKYCPPPKKRPLRFNKSRPSSRVHLKRKGFFLHTPESANKCSPEQC